MDGRRLEMVNQPSDPAVPRQQFMQQRCDLFLPAHCASCLTTYAFANPIQRVPLSTIEYCHI